MENKQLDFFEIEKKANQLRQSQREIIQQILDQGFDHKETDFSQGYIRGVEDLLNGIFNINRSRPLF